MAKTEVQASVLADLGAGDRILVYFDQKIGGEISLAATANSPEMAFDVTLVELIRPDPDLGLGAFSILEVQTMDFHGSYAKAVSKLRNALELHPRAFPEVLQQNQWWAGDGIEGPNIANVFKRTFYQMMFKFNFGQSTSCAGTSLAIPAAVWDSWQPFLASPPLTEKPDGTYRLARPEDEEKEPAEKVPAWIFVFDFDADTRITPNPVRFLRTIGVTADALAYYALKAAPQAASRQLMSEAGIYATLQRRLQGYLMGHALRVVGC